jgi:hypothetical protein
MIEENPGPQPAIDPVLALVGAGQYLWVDVDADEYVRNLREGWE